MSISSKGLMQAVIIVIGFTVIFGILIQTGVIKNNKTNDNFAIQPSISPSDDQNDWRVQPPNKTVELTLDVLQALNNYYASTQNEITEYSDTVDIMTAMLNSNKYLESGNAYMEKYLKDASEVTQVVAMGMTKGADGVIQANKEVLEFLRSDEQKDYEYTIATYLSNQKEAYKIISTSAPWVTSLIFEPAKSENPSGKIPYTISDADRKKLLREIERLFGDDLESYRAGVRAQTGKHNVILFSVDAIYKRIAPETYEEAKNLENY